MVTLVRRGWSQGRSEGEQLVTSPLPAQSTGLLLPISGYPVSPGLLVFDNFRPQVSSLLQALT